MQRRFFQRHLRSLVSACAALIITGCSSDSPTGPRGPQGEFVFSASVIGTTIATMVVEVTAPDITTPLVFNISIVNNVASGTIKLPPGENRTITLKAYDNLGNQTHEGSKTINVKPGQNPPVSIPVVSKAGQITINAIMGAVSIVVTPGAAELAAGGTVQLTALITAPNGDPLTGPADWATLNPSIASVNANGLVTAVGEGSVQIVATYAGVGGSSTITIGSRLAVVGNSILTVFDPASLSQVATFPLPDQAFSVTSASDGRLYVGGSGSVTRVDPSNGVITTFGAGVLNGIVFGISSRAGLVYAAVYNAPEVQTFNLDGTPNAPVPIVGGSGNVRSTAFGPNGNFYLTDFTFGTLHRYGPGFVPLGNVGAPGLTSAFGVDVRSNGNVIVTGQNDGKYFVFSPSGSFIRSVPVNCSGQITNVAVDFSDNVWVACQGSGAVVKFNTADQEVARIAVNSPFGVAIY